MLQSHQLIGSNRRRVKQLVLPIFLLILTSNLSCNHPKTKRENPKPFNVLFIVIDDLNDWTGFLKGHPQAQTPHMDKLAEQGMVFTRAYCPAPSCNPSRVAILSGYRPSTTSVYGNNDFMKDSKILKHALTMPQYFSKHGYFSTGMGKVFHGMSGKWANPNAWDVWYPPKGNKMNIHPLQTANIRVNGMPSGTKVKQLMDWGPIDIAVEETNDYQTAKWAAEELHKNHEKPFFIACGIYRPHLPWYVPKKYFDAFPLEKIKIPEINDNDLEDIPELGKLTSGGLDPNGDYQQIKRHKLQKEAIQAYLASIKYADECVGIILDALDKSPYGDNTVVVLWGDHGWHLGEKLHYRKFTLWEESSRVPLIIKVPGLTEHEGYSSRTVNLLDLYPTLLDLCGLPANPNNEGQSIVPLLKNPETKWEYPALTTSWVNNHTVRTEKWRYIRYWDNTEELYNHETDSLEWNNLADDPNFKEVKANLSHHLPITWDVTNINTIELPKDTSEIKNFFILRESQDSYFTKKGWVSLEGVSSEFGNTWLILESGSERHIYGTSKIKRYDLVHSFSGLYLYAGFEAKIPKKDLKKGIYRIGFLFTDGTKILGYNYTDELLMKSYEVDEIKDLNLTPTNNINHRLKIREGEDFYHLDNAWAFIEGYDSSLNEVFVIIKSDNHQYVYRTQSYKRPGLRNRHGKKYLLSGFKGKIPKKELVEDTYQVSLLITQGAEILGFKLTNIQLTKE